MKPSAKYEGQNVTYKLDTKDGQWVESQMPVDVAIEVIRTAKKVDMKETVIIADDMHFPIEAFEFDGADAVAARPEAQAKPKTRRAPRSK